MYTSSTCERKLNRDEPSPPPQDGEGDAGRAAPGREGGRFVAVLLVFFFLLPRLIRLRSSMVDPDPPHDDVRSLSVSRADSRGISMIGRKAVGAMGSW